MNSQYSYFDFAENDYQYHMKSIDNGEVYNAIASGAQNVCERYLKHIIELGWKIDDSKTLDSKERILHTHNLKTLLKAVEQHTNVEFTKEEKLAVKAIDGFYYSARYPGEDSAMVTKEDIEDCKTAMNVCRYKTIDFCKDIAKNRDDSLNLTQVIEGADCKKKFADKIKTQLQEKVKEAEQEQDTDLDK